jgi:hypothetical protein
VFYFKVILLSAFYYEQMLGEASIHMKSLLSSTLHVQEGWFGNQSSDLTAPNSVVHF